MFQLQINIFQLNLWLLLVIGTFSSQVIDWCDCLLITVLLDTVDTVDSTHSERQSWLLVVLTGENDFSLSASLFTFDLLVNMVSTVLLTDESPPKF